MRRALGWARSVPLSPAALKTCVQVHAGIEARRGRGARLPDTRPPLRATASAKGLGFDFADEARGTRINARASGVEVRAFVEDAGDSLGVVVPWSDRLFQSTVKSVARPVSGELFIDGVSIEIPAGESWACLDRGRGRWPYHIMWNCAAGSGLVGAKRVGLQLGGKWTVGTGATENALFVDGVMHYIPDELRWEYDPRCWQAPCRIQGERVDVTLEPFYVRSSVTNLLVLVAEVHQAFGRRTDWMSDTRRASRIVPPMRRQTAQRATVWLWRSSVRACSLAICLAIVERHNQRFAIHASTSGAS